MECKSLIWLGLGANGQIVALWTQNPVGFEVFGGEVIVLASDFTVGGRSSVRGRGGTSDSSGLFVRVPAEDSGEDLRKLSLGDHLLDAGRHRSPRRLRVVQLVSYQGDVDPGEQIFQGWLVVEQDLHVAIILEILHQRCFSQHGLQCPAHGVVTAASTMAAAEIAEEAFHEVIGSLWLNGHFTVGCVNQDGIGEQLLPVLVDLVDHGLVCRIARVRRLMLQSLAKLSDVAFDRLNVIVRRVVIQSVRPRLWRHSYRLP